jgi:hypothetical protein
LLLLLVIVIVIVIAVVIIVMRFANPRLGTVVAVVLLATYSLAAVSIKDARSFGSYGKYDRNVGKIDVKETTLLEHSGSGCVHSFWFGADFPGADKVCCDSTPQFADTLSASMHRVTLVTSLQWEAMLTIMVITRPSSASTSTVRRSRRSMT